MNDNIIPVNNDWPYNLLQDMDIEERDPILNIDDIGNLEIAMGISSMTPREKAAVRMRYARGMTLKEVGNELGVQQERARQIILKAIRKLRGPAPKYIITYGIKAYVDKRINEGIEKAWAIRKDELERIHAAELAIQAEEIYQQNHEADNMAKVYAMTIEELNLSLRPHNCLKRAGCNTVYDIVKKYPEYEDSIKIRNLGRKSLDEICIKLRSLGIVWPKDYRP